jgi:hypothetical protein
MLSIIAKWWIKPGCKKEALAALDELAESTEQQEPFTSRYLIHTSVAAARFNSSSSGVASGPRVSCTSFFASSRQRTRGCRAPGQPR